MSFTGVVFSHKNFQCLRNLKTIVYSRVVLSIFAYTYITFTVEFQNRFSLTEQQAGRENFNEYCNYVVTIYLRCQKYLELNFLFKPVGKNRLEQLDGYSYFSCHVYIMYMWGFLFWSIFGSNSRRPKRIPYAVMLNV